MLLLVGLIIGALIGHICARYDLSISVPTPGTAGRDSETSPCSESMAARRRPVSPPAGKAGAAASTDRKGAPRF